MLLNVNTVYGDPARILTEPFGIVNVPSLFAHVDLDGRPVTVAFSLPPAPAPAVFHSVEKKFP